MCCNTSGVFWSSFQNVEKVSRWFIQTLVEGPCDRLAVKEPGDDELSKEEWRPDVKAEGFYTAVFLMVISNLVSD